MRLNEGKLGEEMKKEEPILKRRKKIDHYQQSTPAKLTTSSDPM